MIHGEKAHSCYFSRNAFANMVKDNPYADNKEMLLIPDAVHTELYDQVDMIPFNKMEKFFKENLCKWKFLFWTAVHDWTETLYTW